MIVDRATWGARHDNGAGPAPLPAAEVWLHHSVTVAPDLHPPFDDEDAAMRALEAIGEQRFGRGVSYTFAVMPTGRAYEGHGVDRLGAHTKGRNSTARAIVLVGNYDVATPTPEQLEGTARLLVDGWRRGWWLQPRLAGGHQTVPGAATACPGRNAMHVLHKINERAAELATIDQEDDDMPSAEEVAQAVWTMPLDEDAADPRGDWGARTRLLALDVNAQRTAQQLAGLQRTLAAQQATLDGMARLLAGWSGLTLEDVRSTISEAIDKALAEGIDLDVSVATKGSVRTGA